MARSKGTLSLSSNIEPSMNAPLDARTVVNTLADLTDSGSFPYFYEGMIVSCKANKKVYQLIGDDPTDEENWQEVGSSGGSEVSITPVLTSGRKIADFEIDGEAGELYAPSSSGGSGSVEYAYDEIKVGTWVDGSNVYQIVVPITIPTTSTDGTSVYEDTTLESPIGVLVKFNLVINGDDFCGETPIWESSSPQYNTRGYIYNRDTLRIVNSCANYSGLIAYAIIQYTKDNEPTYVALIPTMTSNTEPSGVASFKGGEDRPSRAAWKAFDGTTGHTDDTVAFSALTYQSDDYLQYEFDSSVLIASGIINWYSAETVPKTLMIDVSTDGTNYTEVYRSSINSGTLEYTFELTSPVQATYVRAHQIDGRWGGGDQRMSVDRLQFYGYEV